MTDFCTAKNIQIAEYYCESGAPDQGNHLAFADGRQVGVLDEHFNNLVTLKVDDPDIHLGQRVLVERDGQLALLRCPHCEAPVRKRKAPKPEPPQRML